MVFPVYLHNKDGLNSKLSLLLHFLVRCLRLFDVSTSLVFQDNGVTWTIIVNWKLEMFRVSSGFRRWSECLWCLWCRLSPSDLPWQGQRLREFLDSEEEHDLVLNQLGFYAQQACIGQVDEFHHWKVINPSSQWQESEKQLKKYRKSYRNRGALSLDEMLNSDGFLK